MRSAALNRLAVLFFALLGLGAAQAGGLEDVLKGLLKDSMGGKGTQDTQATPQQPAGQAPAKGQAEFQLLGALLKGDPSQEEEVRIGRRIAGNLLGVAPLVRDDGLQRYVNNVGRWVSLQSERPGLPWRFGVIESEDINAFAAPGGYIFLTKGLYRRLHNEAELAGVLGHEIGHVIRKHHLKLLQESQAIAAVGSLVGRKFKDEDQLIQNLIGNGAEVVARSLDKDAEYEADRIGVVLTARAGYDAYALPAVLAEIGHVAKNDQRVSLLFKTHPHPEERLGRLGEAVGDHLDTVPEGQSLAGRFYRLR